MLALCINSTAFCCMLAGQKYLACPCAAMFLHNLWLPTASARTWSDSILCLQVLLRFGILTSQQAPTDLHPYGYLKDKFLWSLVSAVGIFCLGAGVTVAHGVMTLGAPPAEMHHMGWNAAGATCCSCTDAHA